MKLTRREFVASGMTAGFALAVRPVSAETIRTDTEGLKAGPVEVPAGDVDLPAYAAAPQSGGPFPVVLVVQEIFGVHEHIRDVCRRFAKQGSLAVAPELYVRQGDVAQLSDIGEIIRTAATTVLSARQSTKRPRDSGCPEPVGAGASTGREHPLRPTAWRP